MVETYEKVGTGASNERFHMLIADRGVANFRVVRAVLLFLCVHARARVKRCVLLHDPDALRAYITDRRRVMYSMGVTRFKKGRGQA